MTTPQLTVTHSALEISNWPPQEDRGRVPDEVVAEFGRNAAAVRNDDAEEAVSAVAHLAQSRERAQRELWDARRQVEVEVEVEVEAEQACGATRQTALRRSERCDEACLSALEARRGKEARCALASEAYAAAARHAREAQRESCASRERRRSTARDRREACEVQRTELLQAERTQRERRGAQLVVAARRRAAVAELSARPSSQRPNSQRSRTRPLKATRSRSPQRSKLLDQRAKSKLELLCDDANAALLSKVHF